MVSNIDIEKLNGIVMDIKSEVDFWVNVMVCYVLGENLLLLVMEGFFKRVWGKYGIDRIILIVEVVFIVWFNSYENWFKVFDVGLFMFDKKYVILKFWLIELDIRKFDVSRVLI